MVALCELEKATSASWCLCEEGSFLPIDVPGHWVRGAGAGYLLIGWASLRGAQT